LTESTDNKENKEGKTSEPPEPPEEGLWFDLGRDNHQKTPAGRILLAFKFIDANPKPREPRKTVDKGRSTAITPMPPSQPKTTTTTPTITTDKSGPSASGPKPPGSPKPGPMKEEKKDEKIETGPELTHLTTQRPKVGGKKNKTVKKKSGFHTYNEMKKDEEKKREEDKKIIEKLEKENAVAKKEEKKDGKKTIITSI